MTIRVGNCSGYYGDRISAMREMLEGGDLDYLTGDYLAELTMLILGRDQLKDPSRGYARTFLRQVTDCFSLAQEKGVKIVANAGGVNPAGLAEALREAAQEQGLDVAIAHVEGDDLRHRTDELGGGDWGDVLTANAYLGAFGIAAALEAGADVVVTGRVTDASVVVGPAIHAHGWKRDDLDALAGAVVAGHVIECGTQATGGNYSGFRALDLSAPLGFPIAEIDADGSSVITKHESAGGAVTVDTVTAQLVYEIQGPAYGNPDVVTHLDSIELSQEGDDRVRISGVRGAPPPPTTKVCLNALGGFRNTVAFQLTGLDIPAKASWIRAQMDAALAADAPDEVEWHLDRTDTFDPATQAQATSVLHCHVRSSRPEPVGRSFSDAAVQVALASYPGFYLMAPPSKGAPFGEYRAAYVPQDTVPHVVVLPDGSHVDIAPPSETSPFEPNARVDEPPLASPPADTGETRAVPLGELAYARSGDKGGNANVGVWIPAGHPQRDAAYGWLAAELTPERVRELLPEAAELEVEVHALPRIAAVNVIIHGLLGAGVASSTRLDPQAKAVGEWLRARVVSIPATLIPVVGA
ncbi:acyclic terpene utilization AtuA family protein [Aeromicrobium sp. Leaf350]|uniref:acyclic terpene utilization AtuA family protein n=1 Tax=Aeromicrobium sp. Leaf350 TaxID=2876565 RepID=UPI001E5E9E54|nr:acyclic terpene utilization AtuA family protein [Aeromicrobium sp. Leaf350]